MTNPMARAMADPIANPIANPMANGWLSDGLVRLRLRLRQKHLLKSLDPLKSVGVKCFGCVAKSTQVGNARGTERR